MSGAMIGVFGVIMPEARESMDGWHRFANQKKPLNCPQYFRERRFSRNGSDFGLEIAGVSFGKSIVPVAQKRHPNCKAI